MTAPDPNRMTVRERMRFEDLTGSGEPHFPCGSCGWPVLPAGSVRSGTNVQCRHCGRWTRNPFATGNDAPAPFIKPERVVAGSTVSDFGDQRVYWCKCPTCGRTHEVPWTGEAEQRRTGGSRLCSCGLRFSEADAVRWPTSKQVRDQTVLMRYFRPIVA